jgi:hypothetical protein
MGTTFRLYINTILPPEQLLEPVCLALGEEVKIKRLVHGSLRHFTYEDPSGLLVEVYPPALVATVLYDDIKSHLGIDSTGKIAFFCDYRNYQLQHIRMLKGVFAVLKNVEGDAVFLYEVNAVLLLRKDGNLIVSTENIPRVWEPSHIADVPFPHQTQDLSDVLY